MSDDSGDMHMSVTTLMNAKIITVTLNAAIDTTYVVDTLTPGSANRIQSVQSQAGGKGINISRVLSRLGKDVTTLGFVGGETGRQIASMATSEGIPSNFTKVSSGESRRCLAVLDRSSGVATELLEPGITVDQSDVDRLADTLRDEIRPHGTFVIFSGSLPRGCTADDLHRLVKVCQGCGAEVAVDTSGHVLKESLSWGIFTAKPNVEEFSVLLDRSVPNTDRQQMYESLVSGLQMMSKAGVKIPIVTLGEGGALFLYEGVTYQVQAPRVESGNAVGSGDAFLGGLIFGLTSGYAVTEAFKYAASAGLVNVQSPTAGQVDPEKVFAYVAEVRVEQRA